MKQHTVTIYGQDIVLSDMLVRGTKLLIILKNNDVQSEIEKYVLEITKVRQNYVESVKESLVLIVPYLFKLLDTYYSGNCEHNSISLFHLIGTSDILTINDFVVTVEAFNFVAIIIIYLEIDLRILRDEDDCTNALKQFSSYIKSNPFTYLTGRFLGEVFKTYDIIINKVLDGNDVFKTSLSTKLMKCYSITDVIKCNISLGKNIFVPLRFIPIE